MRFSIVRYMGILVPFITGSTARLFGFIILLSSSSSMAAHLPWLYAKGINFTVKKLTGKNLPIVPYKII